MPHSTLDFRQRAQLTERIDEPCSREELRACLRDVARLNRWFLAYRPLLEWLNAVAPPRGEPLRILDVGCGYGDGLRRIERWARVRGIAVELTGLDLNPNAVAIAKEATPAASRIKWIDGDVFAYSPPKPTHLVISSLFTHHLADADVIRFLQWMEQNARLGWLINDLSRAAIPYYLLRIFSKTTGLHAFVQHDGPVSIARSFVAGDWRRMCVAAGLREQDVWIRRYAPARLCVGRSKGK